MDFWIRLKNTIKSQNTTQEWVSGKIGVPLSTFRKWMTRKTYPDLKQGLEIAKLLDTSVEYLVTGVNPKKFNTDEQHIVTAYRKLSREDQINITLIINALLRKPVCR